MVVANPHSPHMFRRACMLLQYGTVLGFHLSAQKKRTDLEKRKVEVATKRQILVLFFRDNIFHLHWII